MATLFIWTGSLFAGLALLGAGYALAAAFLARRFMRARNAGASAYPAVTVLKPLHQGEPGLSENLESFFTQDYPNFEIIFALYM